MELVVVNSNSAGNSYLLEASDDQQLCIEAGRPIKEVKSIGGLKTAKCVGVLTSHVHQDHSKYIKDFIKAGIDVYTTPDCAKKNLGATPVEPEKTIQLGKFSVTPLSVEHDVPCYAYLIHHEECGTIYFFTDAYNMKQVVTGCDTYMCECNYEDNLLDRAVREGMTLRSQADRIRLSHMSQAHAIEFLRDCKVENSAKQIILIHGSARHLNPDMAVSKFQQVLGVPTLYAYKGMTTFLL